MAIGEHAAPEFKPSSSSADRYTESTSPARPSRSRQGSCCNNNSQTEVCPTWLSAWHISQTAVERFSNAAIARGAWLVQALPAMAGFQGVFQQVYEDHPKIARVPPT